MIPDLDGKEFTWAHMGIVIVGTLVLLVILTAIIESCTS